MRFRIEFAAVFAGFVAAVAGCTHEAPPRVPESTAVVAPSASVVVPSDTAPSPSETPAEPFQPPYPNRAELFIPPDLTHVVRAPSSIDGPDVAVRGFMSLDRQHVVLEINGAVHVLEEGEQHAGVQVVSIAPPRVVLQRRGERWTAQLLRGR
jgi:hypothetical protein